MHVVDDDGALADGRGDALHRPGSDVADREDARHGRLVRAARPARDDEPTLVALDLVGKPRRPRLRSVGWAHTTRSGSATSARQWAGIAKSNATKRLHGISLNCICS